MLQLRLQLNKKLLQAPGNGCLFFLEEINYGNRKLQIWNQSSS